MNHSMRVSPFDGSQPCLSSGYPEAWFPIGQKITDENTIAMRICQSCHIQAKCLEWAVQTSSSGIWGGQRLSRGLPWTIHMREAS